MNLRTTSAFGAALLITAFLLPAQDKKLSCDGKGNGKPNYICEMREMSAPVTGRLSVDAAPNGGIRLVAWDRNEILVRTKVEAWGDSAGDAKDRLSLVSIQTAGATVKADGPRSGVLGKWGEQKWNVSYEVFTPRKTDLNLESVNGGISVTDVRGNISFETVNGGVSLSGVNGTVKGESVNGGISVDIAGTRWEGTGLDVETVNGGVTLSVPASFQATVHAETVNGGLNSDFPGAAYDGTPRPRKMEIKLGGGGAPVKVETVNGGVRIRRKA
jgi:hypothetical protein